MKPNQTQLTSNEQTIQMMKPDTQIQLPLEQPIQYFMDPIYQMHQPLYQIESNYLSHPNYVFFPVQSVQPVQQSVQQPVQQPVQPVQPVKPEQFQTIPGVQEESVKKQLIEYNYPGIDGYGYVLMGNQEQKQVYNLKKGDIVKSFDQNNNMITSKVKYIVKTKINNLIMLSYLNNIAISSNHQIQVNNSDWICPNEILNTYNSKIDYLYNIVLENGCGVIINNLKVITLGYYNSNKRDQTYYASQSFVTDISKYDINSDGYIVLEKPYLLKNKNLDVEIVNNI
jgi:hypothetical protein